MNYKLTKYFKLKELMTWGVNREDFEFNAWNGDVEHNTARLYDAINNTGVIKNLDDIPVLNFDYKSENVARCSMQVSQKFENEYCLKVNFKSLEELNNFEKSEVKTLKCYVNFVKQLCNVFSRTFDFYNALLKGYEFFANELVAEITQKSTSTSSGSNSASSSGSTTDKNENIQKFSDTPQSSGVDLLNDKYITNITKITNDGSGTSTTESSGKDSRTGTTESNVPYTPMQRLTEIQNAYKRTLADWVNEFRGLFLENQGDDEDEEF